MVGAIEAGDALRVLLGPAADLHTGLHGALVDDPPANVTYVIGRGHYVLGARGAAPALFDEPLPVECWEPGDPVPIVHSAKRPVLNCRAWIADFESVMFPLALGHFGLNKACEAYARPETRPHHIEAAMRVRLENMGRAFAHRSCKAIVLYNGTERRAVDEWTTFLSDRVAAREIRHKTRHAIPVPPPMASDDVARKWASGAPLRVLYCGLGFEQKRGQWAMEMIDAVAASHAVILTVAGDVPENVRAKYCRAPTVRLMGQLSREATKREMANAHVLFHPSPAESVGAVLLEAMASAAAVVGCCGPGLEQVTEWGLNGGACLVNNQLPPGEQLTQMVQAVVAMAERMDWARSIGLQNWRQATSGVVAARRQAQVLRGIYDEAVASPAERPLVCSEMRCDLPYRVHRATEQWVWRQRDRYRRVTGDTRSQVSVDWRL